MALEVCYWTSLLSGSSNIFAEATDPTIMTKKLLPEIIGRCCLLLHANHFTWMIQHAVFVTLRAWREVTCCAEVLGYLEKPFMGQRRLINQSLLETYVCSNIRNLRDRRTAQSPERSMIFGERRGHLRCALWAWPYLSRVPIVARQASWEWRVMLWEPGFMTIKYHHFVAHFIVLRYGNGLIPW